MSIGILNVLRGSIADRAGILAGDTLLKINGEDVLDEIDYQALTATRRLELILRDQTGKVRIVHLLKSLYSPLGVQLDERIVLEPRICKNHCVFCFVDQPCM